MKLQGAAIERFLARPDPAVRAILLYGGDEGLVRERAAALGRQVVPDLNDAFRVATLAADSLAADPTLLVDEASALSLMGGRRLIRIRDGSDRVTRAVGALLDGTGGDSLTIIEAGDLSPRSSLRKLVEAAPSAAAVPCYVEDEAALARTLRGQIEAAGKTIDADAERLLAGSLVGDRALARGEVEKLLLYVGERQRIEAADVTALVVDVAALEMDDAVTAAAVGDLPGLIRCLARLEAESVSGVGLLRIAQNHFRRLHVTRARVEAGTPVEQALGQLQPPLFFRARQHFAQEVRRWPLARLAAALERLVEAEASAKRTGADDVLLARDALLAVARVAKM